VLFVVPILIAIILFLLYFTGLRILANAGYYLRIEQEQQFKSVSRITETITFYGLENNLIDSLVKPSYSLLDPKEVYVEVLDQGNMVYSYGNPQIYSASAIVGLIDVNPELQGIVYQSNNTFVYEMRKYDGRHAYVYHIAIKRATHGSDSLMETVSFYIIVVAILLFIVTFFAINRFVTRFIMIHVKNMTKSLEMANRQIEMEQEQQKELLAGISHDIRTPLTAIKAYAEGVRDGIAPTEEQAKNNLDIVADKWESKYPKLMSSWYSEWDAITPIFKFSVKVRTVIYTTNAVESVNSRLRSMNKRRSVFPNKVSLEKALYLAIERIVKKWTGAIRDWGGIYGELRIMYEDRI